MFGSRQGRFCFFNLAATWQANEHYIIPCSRYRPSAISLRFFPSDRCAQLQLLGPSGFPPHLNRAPHTLGFGQASFAPASWRPTFFVHPAVNIAHVYVGLQPCAGIKDAVKQDRR